MVVQSTKYHYYFKMDKTSLISQDVLHEEDEKHKEEHIQAGEYLKSLVYGGLDGCINTLIIVLSGVSSNTSAAKILAFCISAVVGDSIGMGLGDYLSARSQIQFIKAEEARQIYEAENMVNNQRREIIDIYQSKGFNPEDSKRISELYATNKKAFVNIMMLEELGLVVIDESMAYKCGAVTFLAFLLFGVLPAVPYIVSSGILKSQDQQQLAVMCIGAVELFSLGYAKAALIGLNKLKSSLQTLILGSAIVGIGYAVGILFSG